MQKEVYEIISKRNSDLIIERKICETSGVEFPIFQSDLDFYNKISPTFNGKKYQIPTPKLCPKERARRRMIFRNERKLYRSKCALTQKPLLTIYYPDNGYTVYDNKVWRSDQRNALDYAQDFDFLKTFNEQFGKLLKKVPHPAVFNTNSDNSLYCNHVGDMKNAYLTSASWDCEDIMYSSKSFKAIHCVDVYETFRSEQCYQTIECENCYKLQRSQQCENCRESYLLFDCHNCDHCFGCWNLVGKQYHFFNKPLTKEEYYQKIEQYVGSRKAMEAIKTERTISVQTHSINKPFQSLNSENCRGNRISNSQNCLFSYNVSDVKDCKYTENAADESSDLYDMFGAGLGSYLSCEGVDTGLRSSNTFTTCVVHECHNTYYSRNCKGCSDIFGCVGLVNQKYCIFNKQYSKQEYEQLVPKIIEHMIQSGERGEFFTPSYSPFAYNESIAQENYPLTREQALKKGYHWFDGSRDPKISEGSDTIYAESLPDNIEEIDGEICKKTIICVKSERPYRIQQAELKFYKKNNIPLPTQHPDIRHLTRVNQKAGRDLFTRKCDKCKKQILSVYKTYKHKVYCETCYQKEIY